MSYMLLSWKLSHLLWQSQKWNMVDRGVLTPLHYEDPLYFLPPFQTLSTPPPCPHKPPIPLLFLLSCFFEQMGDHTTFDVLLCLMILRIHICQTLMCVLCNKASSLLRSDLWFFASALDLMSHRQTHSHSTFRGQ